MVNQIASVPHETGAAWSNWAGNVTTTPHAIAYPRSAREVQAVVNYARERNLRVRTVGSGFSWVALVATDDVLISLRDLSGLVSVNPDEGRASFRAGTVLHNAAEALWENGLSFPQQGGFSGQTLAGATATAAHGSSLEFGSMSTLVRKLTLIDGRGNLRVIDESAVRELEAARVSLGALGVIIEIEFDVVPAFYLRRASQIAEWDEWLSELNDRRGRSSLVWAPTPAAAERVPELAGVVGAQSLIRRHVPAEADEPGALPAFAAFSVPPALVPKPFDVFEYVVPLADAVPAIHSVREHLSSASLAITHPLSLRAVQGDSSPLSPYCGRDSLTISAAGEIGSETRALFSVMHDALKEFAPRPHLGKIHCFTGAELAACYPDLRQFEAVRQEFDPDGIFLNDYLQQLFGE